MATAFPVRAQTALRALSRDIPMRRSEPYPPSSHLAKFSTSTPSRVWGSCLVRVMRIFGNASPMDRIGADIVAHIHFPSRFRNLEGSMRKDASRCDPSRTMPAEMSRHIRSCCNAGIGDEKQPVG